MLYLGEDDLAPIFSVIAGHYTNMEEVPNYFDEKEGIENLLGVFERVHMDFYPTLIDKAVFLFIQINKGHFFSNGNKRLALVVAAVFIGINDKRIAQLNREKFKKILTFLFRGSEDSLEEYSELRPEEYALYNLSIIVADSHKYVTNDEGFDVLKQKVVDFFNKVIEN